MLKPFRMYQFPFGFSLFLFPGFLNLYIHQEVSFQAHPKRQRIYPDFLWQLQLFSFCILQLFVDPLYLPLPLFSSEILHLLHLFPSPGHLRTAQDEDVPKRRKPDRACRIPTFQPAQKPVHLKTFGSDKANFYELLPSVFLKPPLFPEAAFLLLQRFHIFFYTFLHHLPLFRKMPPNHDIGLIYL